MADLSSLLAVLENDPDDAQAREALAGAARDDASRCSRDAVRGRAKGARDARAARCGRRSCSTPSSRRRDDVDRQVDLLLEKGMVLDGELLDVPAARAAFGEVLELRPDDAMAKEALEELERRGEELAEVRRQVRQGGDGVDGPQPRDRALRVGGGGVRAVRARAPEAEGYLRKALEIDPRNTKAAFHLARLLAARAALARSSRSCSTSAPSVRPTVEEKVAALLALAELARDQLASAARADAAIRRVLVLDPAQPQALRTVTDALASARRLARARRGVPGRAQGAARGEDLGMLLQVAMVLWRHLGDLDQAEEYFRARAQARAGAPRGARLLSRVLPGEGREPEAARAAAAGREGRRAAQRRAASSGARRSAIEIAELAEAQNNPEKAIEAWKQHLRQDPTSTRGARVRSRGCIAGPRSGTRCSI